MARQAKRFLTDGQEEVYRQVKSYLDELVDGLSAVVHLTNQWMAQVIAERSFRARGDGHTNATVLRA